jgi:4'-phosphopantetheinyl transferase
MQQFCRVNCQPETDLLQLQDINAGKAYYQVFYGFSSHIDENFLQELRKSLNPAELERSERYRFQRDRLNYIACRAITRNVLASHLNCHPAHVDLRFSVNDKPFVPGNNLHFNIAHSREMFAVAFSQDGETGIDVEYVNRELDFEKIIKNYFSENERKSILTSGDNARKKFFLYWTRKGPARCIRASTTCARRCR